MPHAGPHCRFSDRSVRWGVRLQAENFGPLRYERGLGDAVRGRAALQRHEASEADVASALGTSTLPVLRRSTKAADYNTREPYSTQFL